MKLQPVIGLEVHVQLKTQSKMFCGCNNDADGLPPNAAICPVCTAQPGALPVLNGQAVRWAALTCMALNCEINRFNKFDRKQYFYPDLPKGYQISQYDLPIGEHGHLKITVEGKEKGIRVRRLHMEEDAAKIIHPVQVGGASPAGKDYSLVDFNRAGTPLLEIVSQPDLRSPAEAKAYLQEMRLLVRALGISDADMEKGQLRCDANISLNDVDPTKELSPEELNSKVEIKNLNSFNAVERALNYEIERQTKIYEAGETIPQNTTRGWDDDKQITKEQRVKEGEADYRYFPEPDLPPLRLTEEWLQEIKASLSELPAAKRARFVTEYGFTPKTAALLTSDGRLAGYAEQVISELQGWLLSLTGGNKTWDTEQTKLIKLVDGWITSRLFKQLEDKQLNFANNPVTAENFGQLLAMIHENKINSSAGQTLLALMVDTKGDPQILAKEHDLLQVSNEADLLPLVKKVIKENDAQVQEYLSGKEVVLQYLVGQIMKISKGQANPELARELLLKELKH